MPRGRNWGRIEEALADNVEWLESQIAKKKEGGLPTGGQERNVRTMKGALEAVLKYRRLMSYLQGRHPDVWDEWVLHDHHTKDDPL